jgi:signal transduction histidine kinase
LHLTPVDEAYEATGGSILLKERFVEAWDYVRAQALSLAAAFQAELQVYLGDACILLWGPPLNRRSRPPHPPLRQAVDVHGIGTLSFSMQTANLKSSERLQRSFLDFSRLCQFCFDHCIKFQSLAHSMAHDMTILLTGTGLALRGLDSSLATLSAESATQSLEQARCAADSVLAESQLGVYLVKNYMAHTNCTLNGQQVRVRVDLNEMLEEMRALHARVAAAKDVIVDPATGPDLPPVYGDPVELQRALHNLFSNAVKYSYRSVPGATLRSVRVEKITTYDSHARPGLRRCAIAISNFGLGVDEDEQRHVFRSGFRGRQAMSAVATGTGIGLAEAQKIAAAHSGKVTFKSWPQHVDDRGEPVYLTKVSLVLPIGRT